MKKRRTPAAAIVLPPEIVETHAEQFAEFDRSGTQVFFAIRAVARRINEQVNDWLAPFGLSAKDINYLASLHACAGRDVSLNELSSLTHSSNAGVTQTVDSLERRGLVARRPHPADRRSTIVRLTPAGDALFARAFAVHQRQIARVAATISDGERAALLDVLARLGASLAEPFG